MWKQQSVLQGVLGAHTHTHTHTHTEEKLFLCIPAIVWQGGSHALGTCYSVCVCVLVVLCVCVCVCVLVVVCVCVCVVVCGCGSLTHQMGVCTSQTRTKSDCKWMFFLKRQQ